MPNEKLKPNALSDQYQLHKQFLSSKQLMKRKSFLLLKDQHLTILLIESLGDGQEVQDMRPSVSGTEA